MALQESSPARLKESSIARANNRRGSFRRVIRGIIPSKAREGLGREKIPGDNILPDFFFNRSQADVHEGVGIDRSNGHIVVRLIGTEAESFGMREPVILYQREKA